MPVRARLKRGTCPCLPQAPWPQQPHGQAPHSHLKHGQGTQGRTEHEQVTLSYCIHVDICDSEEDGSTCGFKDGCSLTVEQQGKLSDLQNQSHLLKTISPSFGEKKNNSEVEMHPSHSLPRMTILTCICTFHPENWSLCGSEKPWQRQGFTLNRLQAYILSFATGQAHCQGYCCHYFGKPNSGRVQR